MNTLVRLIARILGAVLLVDAASVIVFSAFAPRWLLLDERVVSNVIKTEIIVAIALTLGQILVLLGLALGNRRALVALDESATATNAVEPTDLLSLFSVPTRIAYARGVLAVLFGATTLLARPDGVDSYTQGALVLLHLTLVSTATLPLYVASRAAVAHALELAPVAASRDAVVLLVRMGRARRVRRRFLIALAAPVALVAVGASLLVYAHARNADRVARHNDAVSFVAGTLDLVEGRDDGRAAAIAKGQELGFVTQVEKNGQGSRAGTSSPRDTDTEEVIALEDGRAVVRYSVSTPGLATVVWTGVALIAVAIAAASGARIGTRLSQDVLLATREIEATGVVDVLRGSRLFREAYFQSVRRLASAIDELGAVFREFAAAQERAIVARAAAERMRALLLATMSHDLKGPLNAILGFAALLERADLTEGQRESVSIISQRGRELLYLIQTVLDAARIEAGPMDLACHEAPSLDIVMAAALDAQELLQGSSRDVLVETANDLPTLEVDSARIVQALVSLMHAASRMSEKGPIKLRATRGLGGSLRVFVEADTPTLSPEESAQIAEADATASVRLAGRRPMSLGLGLSIARALLEAHGGSLTVTADASAPLRLLATVPAASAAATVRMSAPPEM
jgi:signal transduction histidine kinase